MVKTYTELRAYQNAMDAAFDIFVLTKEFPKEEKYSMVDQIRRSSRSVCANMAEAWRKRRYKAAFISKLSDVESEACETQVWIQMAYRCGYVSMDVASNFNDKYDHIMSQIVRMIDDADKWLIRPIEK